MQRTLRRAVLLTALLAVALMGPVSRAATPATCADPCTISAGAATNFLPAAASISSGSTVVWEAADDFPHASSDTNFASMPCYTVSVTLAEPAVPVRFDITGTDVIATAAPGTPEELSGPCTGAVAVQGGSFLLPYQCRIHPEMHAVLLIEP